MLHSASLAANAQDVSMDLVSQKFHSQDDCPHCNHPLPEPPATCAHRLLICLDYRGGDRKDPLIVQKDCQGLA